MGGWWRDMFLWHKAQELGGGEEHLSQVCGPSMGILGSLLRLCPPSTQVLQELMIPRAKADLCSPFLHWAMVALSS